MSVILKYQYGFAEYGYKEYYCGDGNQKVDFILEKKGIINCILRKK